jgi:hypothetical protein
MDAINENSLIVKKNPLNEAKHNLNTLEYKLTLVAISMIDKNDKELYKIDINVKDFEL